MVKAIYEHYTNIHHATMESLADENFEGHGTSKLIKASNRELNNLREELSKFQIKKDDLRFDLFSRIKMMLNDNIDLSLKNNELRKEILTIAKMKHSLGDGVFS